MIHTIMVINYHALYLMHIADVLLNAEVYGHWSPVSILAFITVEKNK